MHFSSFFARLLLASLLLATHLFSQPAQAQATSWIPFDQSSGHVRIKVKVADIETYAIIDSGSQMNAINVNFLSHHGLDYKSHQWIRVKGVNGVDERPIYKDIPADIVGLEMDMELVGLQLGDPEVGILLGAPLLNQFIFQFDYPNSQMRFAMPGTFDLEKIGNIEMRAQQGSGQPLVKVNLNGETERWVLLDTGNSSGIFMPRNIADSLGWLEKYPTEISAIRGVTAISEVERLRIPTLTFGPFTLENVGVMVPGEGQAFDFSSQYSSINSRIRGVQVSGILGYDVMKHFILTIDYKNGRGHIYVPQ